MSWQTPVRSAMPGPLLLAGSGAAATAGLFGVALTLSALLQQPFTVNGIDNRRGRGMSSAQAAMIEAAAAIVRASVDGRRSGSHSFSFAPGRPAADSFQFDFGHTTPLLLPLAALITLASQLREPSSLNLKGCTHHPDQPGIDYLERHLLPTYHDIGLETRSETRRAGIYPHGGGEVGVWVEPAGRLEPLYLVEGGAVTSIDVIITHSNAEREAEQLLHHANHHLYGISQQVTTELVEVAASGRGCSLLLLLQLEHGRAAFHAAGGYGHQPERLIDDLSGRLYPFLESGCALDCDLAAMVLLPLSLAAGDSQLRVARSSELIESTADVINRFNPRTILLEGGNGQPLDIYISGHPLQQQGESLTGW